MPRREADALGRRFLSAEEFALVIEKYVNSNMTLSELGRKYRVAASTISRHWNKKNLGEGGRKKGLSLQAEAQVVLALQMKAQRNDVQKISGTWIHENLPSILANHKIEHNFANIFKIAKSILFSLRKTYFDDKDVEQNEVSTSCD